MSADISQNGLIFTFTGNAQEENYNAIAGDFAGLNAQVDFADGLVAELQSEVENAGKKVGENNLYIFVVENGQVNFLEVKEGIDDAQNWAEAIKSFAENYQVSSDEGGMYKWGQKVPQAGEYLCVDCGYILELEEGKTFPICETCLSGEPDGPTGPEGAFWELV